MSYVGAGQNKYTVFPYENYTFGNKAPKTEKQRSLEARFKHLRERYAEHGMRRSVDGVALVHKHNTIYVLLLQPNPSFFKLPGGRLRPGEDEVSGLQRKLTRNMGPEKSEELQMRWQIADCLGRFYRPNFETLLYPYCPAHIERPKEVKKVFLVNLPERAFLTVPRNMRVIAVPLFELYDHAAKYGALISSIPLLLSRLHFTLAHAGSVPRPIAPAPPSTPPPAAGEDAPRGPVPQHMSAGAGAPPAMGGVGRGPSGVGGPIPPGGPPPHPGMVAMGGAGGPMHMGGGPQGFGMGMGQAGYP